MDAYSIFSLVTRTIALAILLALGAAAPASAQDQPPRLPFIVVDLHGAFTSFPSSQALVDSRGLTDLTQLPSGSLGGDVALHLYPLRWRAVTFGIGGRVMGARGHQAAPATGGEAPLTPVTEQFLTAAPELSFNFGSGNGWSYISGGIGRSIWQVVPDGAMRQDVDEERRQTSNYGGGARWFMKKHLAFSFDVRVYGVKAGTVGLLPAPRANLLVIAAGASIK
jgi:hypothetical protein